MKLSYFDLAGRGEPIRLALVAGGIDFEDHRFKGPEWAEIKPTTPYGTVPVLEKDGAKLGQSEAILRYAGKLAGLYPLDDHWAAAQVDDIMNFMFDDILGPISATMKMNEEAKMAKRKELFSGPMQDLLAKVDKKIETNGTGFCVGESMTIADLALTSLVHMVKGGFVDGLPTTMTDSYANIVKCNEKALAEPKIAAYLAAKSK